jgi:hypothetical protein
MPVEQLQTVVLEDFNSYTTEPWPVALLWARMAFQFQQTFLTEAVEEAAAMPAKRQRQCLDATVGCTVLVGAEVALDKDLQAARAETERRALWL